jgi:hypothetical protein
VPALFVGFLGHITAVVAATVIATSDVADADAGLATGLVTTSHGSRLPSASHSSAP